MRITLDKLNKEIEELYINYNFDLDEIDYAGNGIQLSTRKNGDVGEENAENLCNEILTNYHEGFNGFQVDCQIDTCDEWVHVDIYLF